MAALARLESNLYRTISMIDAGLILITAFISPFRAERRMARSLVGEDEFVERLRVIEDD